MFENLSQFVGYAMHDDLMMRPQKNARTAQAQQGLPHHSARVQGRRYRETVANVLIALAMRLAPEIAGTPVPSRT